MASRSGCFEETSLGPVAPLSVRISQRHTWNSSTMAVIPIRNIALYPNLRPLNYVTHQTNGPQEVKGPYAWLSGTGSRNEEVDLPSRKRTKLSGLRIPARLDSFTRVYVLTHVTVKTIASAAREANRRASYTGQIISKPNSIEPVTAYIYNLC